MFSVHLNFPLRPSTSTRVQLYGEVPTEIDIRGSEYDSYVSDLVGSPGVKAPPTYYVREQKLRQLRDQGSRNTTVPA